MNDNIINWYLNELLNIRLRSNVKSNVIKTKWI